MNKDKQPLPKKIGVKQDIVEEMVVEYRSMLRNLLDKTSFGEYVSSFHHAKVEEWLRTTLLTQIKSTHQDWLRSEIEKLEEEKINISEKVEGDDFVSQVAIKEVKKHEWSYNQALTSIITRYKEELLELENGK